MKTLLAALMGLMILSTPTMAEDRSQEGLVTKPSPHSVADTITRLETVLKTKGITVFTRFDHAAGAKSVDIPLEDTQVLVFGNPKLGTPLMQINRTVAIDLPLKALAWQDAKGSVWLAYSNPEDIAARHGIPKDHPVIQKMVKALNAFTDHATSTDKL